MKTKQLFFCSLTGLALLTTSCSSNDEALNGGKWQYLRTDCHLCG